MTKTVQYQNELHKFLIWDTAGQERVSHSLIYYVFLRPKPNYSSNYTVIVPVVCHSSLLCTRDTFTSICVGQPFSFQLEPQSPLMEKVIMGTEGIFILFSVLK